jgi:hypothetical protein
MVESTFEWTYDNLNRLTGEKCRDYENPGTVYYSDSYEYDLAGNRTKRIHTQGSLCRQTDYEYNERNQLVKETHNEPFVCFYLHDKPVFAYSAGGRITHYRLGDSPKNIGPLRAWLMGVPTQWSNYIVTTVLGLLPVIFLLPMLLSFLRKQESKRFKHIPLFHRSLCVLLAYMMFTEPAGVISLLSLLRAFLKLGKTKLSTIFCQLILLASS